MLTNFYNPTWHHITSQNRAFLAGTQLFMDHNPTYKIIKRNYKATSSHISLPPSTHKIRNRNSSHN